MRALCSSLWNNVFTHDMRIYASRAWRNMEDFSTLLLGETGTGKGSAAATIGRSGFIPYDIGRQRFKANFMQSFVTLNLCQFPETLLESELFGHRKGAFTGAVEHHAGALARCSEYGALFLDEIGEVEGPVQVKLLQVLQERTFTPLGQHTPVRFAGRVIAATNRTLAELHGERGFRDDFFYRLCSDVITVPTLRERISERPDEFDELVAVIIERIFGAADAQLAAQTTLALRRDLPADYVWPGNVRELEQAVRRVLLTGSYRGRASLASRDREDTYLSAVEAGALPADELVGRYCAMLYARSPVYAGVAQATQLDRRTVRKHVLRYS
jgi:transcriptional regulator with GAF, ATPase, and Fis domain